MRISVAVVIVMLTLTALSAVLVTGCGGSGDTNSGGAVGGPVSGAEETHQIGPLVVQTEKTAQFKAEAFEGNTSCSFVALSGAQINYLASTAMMDRVVYSSNRYGTYNLYICDFDGRNAYRLTENNADEGMARWSPDRKKTDFVRDWPGESSRICTIKHDGSGVQGLSEADAVRSWPNWSPDGGQIVYQQPMSSGAHDLFVMYSADGAGKTNMTQSALNQIHPVWSPHGTEIMFSTNIAGKYQLAKARETGTVDLLTDDEFSYFAPAYDPTGSGRYCAYTGRYGNSEIVLFDSNGPRNFTSASSNEANPRFSSDGRYIVYESDRSGNSDIWIQPVDGRSNTIISLGNRPVQPIRAWQVTKNPATDMFPDLGSPTVQTQRVLIGRAGTDLFGNDPIWSSAPGAIVALTEEGYANFVRIGVADNHRASLRLKPFIASGLRVAGIEVSATKIANLREDAGLGEAPNVWDFNAENAGMVLMYFNGYTGKLTTVLPIKDVAFPTAAGSAQAAPYSCSAAGDGSTVTGAFAAVLDADGRNLAPSGATSVTLDAEGQVLSVN